MFHRTVVETANAPQAIGPYSQAIYANQLVFVSGQIPLDPATGEVIAGDVAAQTRRVLHNVQAVLEAAGTSLDRVVKTTIFLTDIGDFGTVNAVYGEFFTLAPPARSTIQVAALPKEAQVEIEVIAIQ